MGSRQSWEVVKIMKRHFGYLLWIGALVADVNQRKHILDAEYDRGILDINLMCGNRQCYPRNAMPGAVF